MERKLAGTLLPWLKQIGVRQSDIMRRRRHLFHPEHCISCYGSREKLHACSARSARTRRGRCQKATLSQPGWETWPVRRSAEAHTTDVGCVGPRRVLRLSFQKRYSNCENIISPGCGGVSLVASARATPTQSLLSLHSALAE